MHHKLICLDCLVGHSEITERLGVGRSTVDNWIKGIRAKGARPFPEPVKVLGKCTKLWDWSEVLDWYENYKPSQGGAPVGNRNAAGTVRTQRGWRNAG